MNEQCFQCGDPAIAVFHFPEGCAVYPDIQRQPLCAQHIVGATPRGDMILTEDLRKPGQWANGIPGYLEPTTK